MERAETSDLEVRHEERGEDGRFLVEGGGGPMAELHYRRSSPGIIVIDHTQVSDALRGRGVGKQLVDAAVAWARRTGVRCVPECTYARAVFDRYPELRDVLG